MSQKWGFPRSVMYKSIDKGCTGQPVLSLSTPAGARARACKTPDRQPDKGDEKSSGNNWPNIETRDVPSADI